MRRAASRRRGADIRRPAGTSIPDAPCTRRTTPTVCSPVSSNVTGTVAGSEAVATFENTFCFDIPFTVETGVHPAGTVTFDHSVVTEANNNSPACTPAGMFKVNDEAGGTAVETAEPATKRRLIRC